MNAIERIGLGLLHKLDPETAHSVSLSALKSGLAPLAGLVTSPRLATNVAGLALPNPVGLAAGYDKNAVAVSALARSGFGFVEVGAATPLPQPGNPRPRLFRLSEDQAAINRFGFNNEGAAVIAARLKARAPGPVPVGLNLGANKTSSDRAADFARVLALCGPHVDFATVNVSSPNTEKLRDLQGPAALRGLLEGVAAANARLARPVPLFLKIAPDLDQSQVQAIAEALQRHGIDGVIATNTTLSREAVQGLPHAQEAGGLSGAPVRDASNRVVRQLRAALGAGFPIIGVGGILSGADAQAKIEAGADVVQIYTGLIYKGAGLVREVANALRA